MEKFLIKLFTWLGEYEMFERAMYCAIKEARIVPLYDKINWMKEQLEKAGQRISELSIARQGVTSDEGKQETKPKRKYTKRKKANNEQK